MAENENTNANKRAPKRVTWDSRTTAHDIRIGRGILESLQMGNGIRSSPGHVNGICRSRIPEENTNEEIRVDHKQEHDADYAFCNAAISLDDWKGTLDQRTGSTGHHEAQAQDTRL